MQWVLNNLLCLVLYVGIWLLFPVLRLYLGFINTSNGMWSLKVPLELFCHHCPDFYITDFLNRFLLSKLTLILDRSGILAEVAGVLGWQLLVFISLFLQMVWFYCWESSKHGKINKMLSNWWRCNVASQVTCNTWRLFERCKKMLLVPAGEGGLRSMDRYWVLSQLSYRNSV